MPATLSTPSTNLSRDFTATTFVVWQAQVLLHCHKSLGLWLPCGGHIEANELPDEAAVREVFEESGVVVELVGEPALKVDEPRQLLRPRGVQLEPIYENHEHIDLIYFARPREPYSGDLRTDDPSLGWYTAQDLSALPLSAEIKAWTQLALAELAPSEGLA